MHHVFRPRMIRRFESKLFLHESEKSAISSPLWFIRILATLRWPCFPWASRNFVQVPFPKRELRLSLDLAYAWPGNSNPESWSNAQRERKCVVNEVCAFTVLALPRSVHVTCRVTPFLFLALHVEPHRAVGIGKL